ncbi:MAG: ABC transporter ATP-binding protein [bacterium]|nr:ABC transporter ATP-binding protein [bacterium]
MLALEGLEKRFDALVALAGIDLEVATGEVLGIIGPNGSGKTTLLNTVTGVYPPSGGRVSFRGTDITGWKGHRIARLGIARTFQNIRLFPTMTVFQNVRAAQHSRESGSLFDRPASSSVSARSVEFVLEQVGLLEEREVLANHLPLPARRRLEVARLLAVDAHLVLLDEPAGGMTPAETADMARLIREVVAPGRTCVVIEHKLALITSVCTRLCVLDLGCKIADGIPDEVLANSRVRDLYLGASDDTGS